MTGRITGSAIVGLCLLYGGLVHAETITGAPATWGSPVHDSKLRYFLLADELEYRANDGPDLFRWEIEGWLGGDVNRVWLKTEGDQRTSSPAEGEAELQVLYGRMIAPFWDFQVGVRQDVLHGSGSARGRTFGAIGVEGLAPYWFELTPTLFVSDDGDVSARLTAVYELLFTQRLILQPRLELNVAFDDAKEFGVESGFNALEMGVRLRYEFRRQFAPYVGFNWFRRLGDTADLARGGGEPVSVPGFVAGIRMWF